MNKYKQLKTALTFGLIDAVSPWMLIFFYLTGIDLLWLVNINFTVMSVFLLAISRRLPRVNTVSVVLGMALVVSMIKFGVAPYYLNLQEPHHYLSYAFGLVMPLAALCFTASFERTDSHQVHAILVQWARKYTTIVVPGIIVYALFYFFGQITYFGLGVNFHYLYPFFLNGKLTPVIAFAAIILISGKRAVLINYLVQTLSYFSGRITQHKASSIVMLGMVVFLLVTIYHFTPLLDRFSWIFNGEFDFSDPYFVLVAGGGRFEELFGIFEYFAHRPFEIIFGAPPGNFYVWSMDWSGYNATKNYSHITFFGLMFRYGVVFAIILYVYFIGTIVRYWGSKDPIYLVVVGVVTSSLFGANLVIDPTSWIFLGLFIQLRPGKPLKTMRNALPRGAIF